MTVRRPAHGPPVAQVKRSYRRSTAWSRKKAGRSPRWHLDPLEAVLPTVPQPDRPRSAEATTRARAEGCRSRRRLGTRTWNPEPDGGRGSPAERGGGCGDGTITVVDGGCGCGVTSIRTWSAHTHPIGSASATSPAIAAATDARRLVITFPPDVSSRGSGRRPRIVDFAVVGD